MSEENDDIPVLDSIPDLEIPDIDLEDFDIPEEEETAVEDESGGSQTFAWIGSGQGGGRIAKAFYDRGYKKCIAVINLGEKQIGPIMSQCLVLGSISNNGDVLLLSPEEGSELGDRVVRWRGGSGTD